MNDTVVVALISLVGTLLGTLGGIVVSNKLTNYRLEKLEEKVNKHNNLIERMYKVEDKTNENERRIEALENKIE